MRLANANWQSDSGGTDMSAWIAENIGTVVIGIMVIAAVLFAVRHMVRAKKQGGSACGCSCSGCAMAGSCHNAAGCSGCCDRDGGKKV